MDSIEPKNKQKSTDVPESGFVFWVKRSSLVLTSSTTMTKLSSQLEATAAISLVNSNIQNKNINFSLYLRTDSYPDESKSIRCLEQANPITEISFFFSFLENFFERRVCRDEMSDFS